MREEIQKKISDSQHTQVVLEDMNIEDNELEEITLLIKKIKPDVQSIFLNNNQISDNGAIILGKEFTTLSALSFIDLQFNKIDKKGAAALFSLKNTHPEIRIALFGNKIINELEMHKLEEAATSSNQVKSSRK